MTSKPRTDLESLRSRETHVYLKPKDHAVLLRRAKAEQRSVNGQIVHYILRGLEQDAKG
jgi:hypothetical protein